MDFSNHLFRCSQLGYLMTEPRSGNGLSETTKKFLRQLHRELRYNREKEFSNRYIQKGLQVEEDAITIYSRVKKRFCKKNSIRLSNGFITGEPDLFKGLEIENAEETVDTKASWDLFTFPYPEDPIDKMYYWQGQGYMDLTKGRRHTVAHCLVNTPLAMIEEEKRRLFYRMNVATMENPDYLKACEELERDMTFDDIPMAERVNEAVVIRDEDAIEAMHQKVVKCRDYLNDLESRFSPSILLASPGKNCVMIENG